MNQVLSGEQGGLDRRALLRSAAVAGVALAATGVGLAGVMADDAHLQMRRMAATTGAPGRPGATRVLWRARTEERVLALTFDDGPSREYTLPLLEVLAQEGVTATFCVVGRRLHLERELIERELRAGHELVNHSYSHADLSGLSAGRLHKELQRTDELIAAVSGHRPALVRPPYGRVSGLVLAAAAALDHDVLLWEEQMVERHETVERNVAHVLDRLRPGLVLLAHDQGPARRRIGMAAVLPIIRGARARGYRFVTASEMFALDAPGYRSGEAGSPEQ